MFNQKDVSIFHMVISKYATFKEIYFQNVGVPCANSCDRSMDVQNKNNMSPLERGTIHNMID